MDALLHILSWFVDDKKIGIPAAIAVTVTLVVLSTLARRAFERREEAEPTRSVQQTTIRGLRAKGNINIKTKQWLRR
jgi:hypothetical protein